MSRFIHDRRFFADIGLIALISMFCFAASARIGLVPSSADKNIAVVFAPWTSAHDVLTRATADGGRFIGFGGLDFIAVVKPGRADYGSRMLGDGAWLVMDAATLSSCAAWLTRNGTAS